MDKITKFEFLARAMENLRTKSDEREYHNLHSVYSGFNSAFRAYFPDSDPVAFIQALAADGKVKIIPAKGGVNIYWPDEAPHAGVKSATDTLAKMGL